MRFLLLVVALGAFHAHADLYRWVDRESGSIKYSNTPPPWFGDPEKARGAPAVEVIRNPAGGAPPKPAAPPEGAAARASAVSALEARWAELAKALASLPPTTDFSRAGSGARQQLEAYGALSAELDRLDPAGTPRRRAYEASLRR
jgi:Domain of unknown function (DUF4124)